MTERFASPQSIPGALTLERVFRDNLAYVKHTLRRLGVRSSELEDLTHDVFLVVHRKLAEYDASRPLKPWLFAIAFRVAQAHRRRRLESHGPDERSADDAGAAALEPEVREERRRIHLAIQAIDATRRDVFILHDLDEVAMPDIVQALGIPLNTGYSRLRLARADFRRAYEALSVEKGAR